MIQGIMKLMIENKGNDETNQSAYTSLRHNLIWLKFRENNFAIAHVEINPRVGACLSTGKLLNTGFQKSW